MATTSFPPPIRHSRPPPVIPAQAGIHRNPHQTLTTTAHPEPVEGSSAPPKLPTPPCHQPPPRAIIPYMKHIDETRHKIKYPQTPPPLRQILLKTHKNSAILHLRTTVNKSNFASEKFSETNIMPETNHFRHEFDFPNESLPRTRSKKRILRFPHVNKPLPLKPTPSLC